ncbi:hypothetical protein ACO1O0_005396 [Amphichorda felina]
MAQVNVARHAAKYDTSALAFQSEAGRDILSDSAPPSVPSSNIFPPSSSPTGNLDEEALLPWELRDHGPMDRLVARGAANGPMTRKKMDEEAIAGTVVGVVLGVALLICCLYPVVVHRLKKRHKRANRLSFDCEGGNFRGEPGISARRLSSSDSFKRNESSRDNPGAAYNYNPHDAYGNIVTSPQGQGRQPSTPGYVNASMDQNLTIEPVVSTDGNYYPNSFPFCNGDAFPAGAPQPHQVVLKGTSEDYYSPYIPSEAFGMYPTPETNPGISKPKRTVSRVNSLGYNVKQLFRRHGTRDRTMSSHTSVSRSYDEAADMPSHLREGTPMQQFFPDRGPTGSPIEMTDASELPFSTRALGPQDGMPFGPSRGDSGASPPQSPYSEMLFSHPSQPAPGTVNPMDIMPASTESEMWHRTDYQLYATSHESPPCIDPVPLPTQPSNAVHQSDLSTPAPGTASITTQSTPSTQVDSPSPESLHSSDYRQSASPHGLGVPSPRGGVYYCDEPGCTQVFDQPHKLKHHQRYHSKAHKCPYPSCGKGFEIDQDMTGV